MQKYLNQKVIKEKKLSFSEFEKLYSKSNKKEFVLFGDNVIECLTVLNQSIEQDLCKFVGIYYPYLHIPIYIYQYKNFNIFIKAAGYFDRWLLPKSVREYVNKYDIPDIVFYSIDSQKILMAAELTETASVGNSEIQREGRRAAASRLNIPFIYQTYFSGADIGQNQIREITSKISYSALLYSIKSMTPSLILYIENPDETQRTDHSKLRNNLVKENYVGQYIIGTLINDIENNSELLDDLHRDYLNMMIDYLIEKVSVDNTLRISKDLPMVSKQLINLFNDKKEKNEFIENLIKIFKSQKLKASFFAKYPVFEFEFNDNWNPTAQFNEPHGRVKKMIKTSDLGFKAPFYNFKVGIINTGELIDYLKKNFKSFTNQDEESLQKYSETAVFPIRVWKGTPPKFNKDPEAGEIVHFAEMICFNQEKKIRGLFAPGTKKAPDTGIDIENRESTSLYRAVSEYVDLLYLNDEQFIKTDNFSPTFRDRENLKDQEIFNSEQIKELYFQEENALISICTKLQHKKNTFINYLAVAHGSWQQAQILSSSGQVLPVTFTRDEKKLDMINQIQGVFILSEGKDKYSKFTTIDEMKKIKQGFLNVKEKIYETYDESAEIIHAFICLENNDENLIKEETAKGSLMPVTLNPYVVITVDPSKPKDNIKCYFSEGFNVNNQKLLKNLLDFT